MTPKVPMWRDIQLPPHEGHAVTELTPWEIKRRHTLALLQQANITLWDGWRVCDPIGDSPILPALREFAKMYKVKDLDLRGGIWGKPKPQLTLAMPDAKNPPLWAPRRSNLQKVIAVMIENTCKDGEVAVYATIKQMNPAREWCRSAEGPGDPDVFGFPEGPERWWVFGRNRGSKTKTLDLRGIE